MKASTHIASSWYDPIAESREAMEAILASPEGQADVADVPNYATGGATFIYTEVVDVL